MHRPPSSVRKDETCTGMTHPEWVECVAARKAYKPSVVCGANANRAVTSMQLGSAMESMTDGWMGAAGPWSLHAPNPAVHVEAHPTGGKRISARAKGADHYMADPLVFPGGCMVRVQPSPRAFASCVGAHATTRRKSQVDVTDDSWKVQCRDERWGALQCAACAVSIFHRVSCHLSSSSLTHASGCVLRCRRIRRISTTAAC